MASWGGEKYMKTRWQLKKDQVPTRLNVKVIKSSQWRSKIWDKHKLKGPRYSCHILKDTQHNSQTGHYFSFQLQIVAALFLCPAECMYDIFILYSNIEWAGLQKN